MKIRIELDEQLEDTEIIIRAKTWTNELARLQEKLKEPPQTRLSFFKGVDEYFISLDELLFFETEDNKVYGHTKEAAYSVPLKLYELEGQLPANFCRIAKSTIVNIKAIYTLTKSFSGTSTISFQKTHKQVHVSRHYYHLLKERLTEMR